MRLELSIKATKLATSFGSLWASFFRLAATQRLAEDRWIARTRLTIDRNVTECGGAVVLNVCVRRVEQADEDWDGSGVNELLAVLVCEKLALRNG